MRINRKKKKPTKAVRIKRLWVEIEPRIGPKEFDGPIVMPIEAAFPITVWERDTITFDFKDFIEKYGEEIKEDADES